MAETRVARLNRTTTTPGTTSRARPGGWRTKLASARRRVPRPVWIVLAIVVGLYVVLAIAMNVILRTRLLRGWINEHPDKIFVDYRSAWSPYPGRVIASDFTLRFQDKNVQMLLDLEKLDMTVDLFDLTRKTFHVRSLDGQGTSLRLRHKLASAEGQEGRLAAYPPITGFPDPPVRKPPPKQEISDESYPFWTIQLEDVASSVRELWIMEYRYRGEGSIAGGMRLRPLRELWLPPSVLITKGGTLSIGEHQILQGCEGRLETHVDPFDVRVPIGWAVLRQITARADLQGELTSITPFGSTYLRNAGIGLAGGRGQMTIKARVHQGLVDPDSRLEWRTNDATVRLPGGLAVRSDLAFVGHVAAGKGGAAAALLDPDARPALVADVALGHASVWSGRDETALATIEDARTVIATANNDLTAPFPLSTVKLDVASLKIPELRRAAALVAPRGIDVKKGSLGAKVSSSYRAGSIDARADVVLDGVHVVTDDVDVATAHGKLWAVTTSKDIGAGVSFGGSGFTLDDVGVRVKESRVGGLGISMEIAEGLARTKSPNGGFDATTTVRVVPGDKVLQLGASLAKLPKALGEAPAGPDAHAKLRVHSGDDGLDVRVLEGRDGDLVARGRVRKTKKGDAKGAFRFEVGILSAGVEIAGGETHVTPFASKEWLDERTR